MLFFPSGNISSLPLEYGPSLYQFCCSVSWRILTHMKLSSALKHADDSKIAEMLLSAIPKEDHGMCDEMLGRWASTLQGGKTHEADQHILFLNGKLVPFERSDVVGFHIFQSKTNLATVAILGPILLLGFIRRGNGWRNTEVSPTGSIFPIIGQALPIEFARWLHDLYFNLNRVAR